MSTPISIDLVQVYRDHPQWDSVDHYTGMGLPLLSELFVATIAVTTSLEEGETVSDLEFHYLPEARAYAESEYPDHVYVHIALP